MQRTTKKERKKAFVTIVLESNRNFDLKTAYDCYAFRWQIELIFCYYKNLHRLDQTMEHGNAFAAGRVRNFISMLVMSRFLKRLSETGVMYVESYSDIMDKLNLSMKGKKK